MAVDKENRDAYKDGKEEADYISDHPINYLITGGIHSRPSDSSEAKAYDKGLSRKKLDNDKGSSSDSSSSSICYLSTACIEYAGLSDNCDELNTLRFFRDNYIAHLPDGKSILEDYYTHAPIIMQNIKNLPNYEYVIKRIYEIVLEAVLYIKNKDYSKAMKCYSEMYIDLKDNYLK